MACEKFFYSRISTPLTVDVVEVDGCYGVVFELLKGKSLSKTITEAPDRFEEFASKYVNLYRSFHNKNIRAEDFPSIKDSYHGYIDGCSDWYRSDELDKLRWVVESLPSRNTLIHGDYHPNNIIVENGDLMVIDMGDVAIGHPIFDFIATAATQVNLVELDARFAEVHTGMQIDLIRKLWNYMMNHYFERSPRYVVAKIDKQVRLLSKLKVALAPVLARGISNELIEASVNDAKENFIPYTQNIVGCIDW